MPDLLPALPEIFVLTMACAILLVDIFAAKRGPGVSYMATQGTLVAAACLTLLDHSGATRYTFGGMYVDDAMSGVLKLMVYIAVWALLVYSREYTNIRGLFRGEFFALTLFAMLGMMIMISASHFLTLYLGLELLSLSLYSTVALARESAVATEAAMKYFVLGALASGLLLYGMSMVYGATGSLQLGEVTRAIHSGAANRAVLVFGLVFIVAGLAFKLGVVPFHMWIPDVYQGAPTAVTLLVSSAPKLAAFAFTLRLLVGSLAGLASDWQGMLIILAVLSMSIGNVTAIAQTNLKRMLAYSTISHMGFVLLGILSARANGFSSAMFYVVIYVLMNLGSFGMILLLSRDGFEADTLEDFKGLNQRNPWYAFMMLLLMFSMAGVPPTVGFYAKLAVLQAILEPGIDLVWLAVVAVVFAVIGSFYYLRIVKLMYMDPPDDLSPISPRPGMHWVLSVNGLAMLVAGILPQPLMALCLTSIQNSL